MARIDGLNLSGASMNPAGAAGAAGAGSAAESQAALKARGKQDVINLSNRGRIVAEASQAVRQSSDVRAERVAALKAAIANGTYSSNAREIAERLIANGLGS
ncbi:MAG TPA: flagellar biosynthesis anti-sigma factor FlgM [Tepidiformaceae bacterium]|nr:flagellar biosynthesis anti-sigma factor FlgM [Tepidiformaceae bacterium]HNO65201.1 flagellar biosynthesis anti-sigma factor FlgM [Tepidiformaceae bacterium]